jgi:GDP-L-fucose synthase
MKKYLNEYLITGGSGMVGKSFVKHLPDAVYISSKDFDLRSPEQTHEMFLKYRPRIVIHLASRVGGVLANMNNLGTFYYDNIMINTNVLEGCRVHNVEKTLSCLSTCIYPDDVNYPLTEDQIHNGPPHSSNYTYAYAKRMIEIQSMAYRQQYNCNFICVSPNNLFGKHDNFDLENSHVIPAIIRKIHDAKRNKTNVTFWGTGEPLREFTYVDDIPNICLFLLNSYNCSNVINIGNTGEISIKHVVDKVSEYFDFNNQIEWDTSKPSGQYRKPSDNSKLINLGWNPNDYSNFDKSLVETCRWFEDNYPNIRGIL